ncbi:MAG: helix-turn-helix domain-containing protein [Flavobacteriales bacterium]
MSFQDRINSIMQHYSLTAKDLAAITGVQRSAISHLLNGRNKPSVAFITQLTAHFNDLNVQWLLHGKGSIVTDVTSVNTSSVDTLVTVDNKAKLSDITEVTNVSFIENEATEAKSKSNDQTLKFSSSDRRVTKIICVYSDGSTSEYLP